MQKRAVIPAEEVKDPGARISGAKPGTDANHGKINSKNRLSQSVTAIITEEFLKVIHTLERVLNNLLANCEFKELVTIKIQDCRTQRSARGPTARQCTVSAVNLKFVRSPLQK